MSKCIIIGGTFDKNGGKTSHFVTCMNNILDYEVINGGTIDQLTSFNPVGYKVVIWMPNISNDEDKILPTLKQKNPRMILVQSKRVIEKEYSERDIVGRLLKSHSLLGLMIEKRGNYNFKLLDPLGNIYCDTGDISKAAYTLKDRLDFLQGLKRVGSIKSNNTYPDIKVSQDFVDIVKKYGEQFSKFVTAVNPYRLLGNASTRCAKGFPAQKINDYILVTKRNVDKETLSTEDFVVVDTGGVDKVVKYYGENKPSVDTPIQIKLFSHFKNIKYMIHGHAYIKNAEFTHSKIPCGFIEEFNDIVSVIVDKEIKEFTINLLGHGCLVCSDNIEYLEDQLSKLQARPAPEFWLG